MYRFVPYFSHHRDGDHMGFYRYPRWVYIISETCERMCALTGHRWCNGIWLKVDKWAMSKTTVFKIPCGKDFQYRDEYYDFMGWDKWWDDEGEGSDEANEEEV